MPALNTDKFRLGSGSTRPSPTSLALPKANGATTAELTSATGWNATTGVDVVMYRRQLNTTTGLYEKVSNTQTDWIAVLTGTTLSSMVLSAGTEPASGYAADGNTVVICAPTAQWADDLVGGLLVSHKQDGTLLGTAVRTALGETASTGAGWSALGFTPNTVTYNGNRSYDLTFNGTDLTGTLSNGMRLRTTRTVAAPTQCASLNGTNQFFSKTAPAGMTFTTAWAAGAWVKMPSYNAGNGGLVISRSNGTNGWNMFVNGNGQVVIIGFNGSNTNYRQTTATQSIPLNKWVHIVAQNDMTVGSTSPTTSYIMIDGFDVPATVTALGTSPTSLVQAGNLEVGSWNNGTMPFPGKIKEAFVTSGKITQTQARAIYSQGLTSTDMATYNIISAYSLSGATGANDLNTINANNLTPNNGVLTTTFDAPWTQTDTATPDGLTDCAIVTKKVFSTNSTITVQVPEGCTIPTSGGVATVSYSSNKVPYGFPADRGKWQVLMTYSGSSGAVTHTGVSVYNTSFLVLNVPIGNWALSYSMSRGQSNSSAAATTIITALATGTFTSTSGSVAASALIPGTQSSSESGAIVSFSSWDITRSTPYAVSTATPILAVMCTAAGGGTIGWYLSGDRAPAVITAECAYL